MSKIFIKDTAVLDAKNKKVVLARDGIMKYAGVELGIKDDHTVHNVLRTTKSVHTICDEVNSIGKLPLTIEHPKKFLNLNDEVNFKRGFVYDAYIETKDGFSVVCGMIDNMSDEIKEKIEKGQEVSLGSEAEIKAVVNDEYDFTMDVTNVNHLAIVDRGRCGSTCAVMDSFAKIEENKMKIKIGDGANEKLDMIAVKENPYSLRVIENPSEAVIKVAIKRCPELILEVEEPTEEMKKIAIKGNAFLVGEFQDKKVEISDELKKISDDAKAELETAEAEAEANKTEPAGEVKTEEETKVETKAEAEEETKVETKDTKETVEMIDKAIMDAKITEATEIGVQKGIDIMLNKYNDAHRMMDAGLIKASELVDKRPCEVVDNALKTFFTLEKIEDSERTGLIALSLKPQIKEGWDNFGTKKIEDAKSPKKSKGFLGRIL